MFKVTKWEFNRSWYPASKRSFETFDEALKSIGYPDDTSVSEAESVLKHEYYYGSIHVYQEIETAFGKVRESAEAWCFVGTSPRGGYAAIEEVA